MAKGYIPRKDIDFFNWQQQLVSMAVANATAWGIPTAAMGVLQQQQAAYEPQYAAISNRFHRTQAQVAGHRKGREQYEKQLRQFVRQWVTFNSAISPAQKLTAGVNPGGNKRSQRPQISDQPMLLLQMMEGQRVKVTCRMEHDSTRPSMHPHADALELRYSVGQEVANVSECEHSHIGTRAVFTLQFQPQQAGHILYAYVRWLNLKQHGRSGPYSSRQQLMIA